jgi:transcriptional regulator with XRE-family HTH domain
MSFSQLLNDKLAASGKTLAEVAESIQVSLASLRGALAGSSVPNKRSLDKYAAFLGLTVDEAAALVKEAKAAAPAAGEKKPKGKGKAKAKAGAKPGRKPGKAGKAKGGALSAALADIAEAINRAEAVLADPLVMKLYELQGAKRKAAEAILGSVI